MSSGATSVCGRHCAGGVWGDVIVGNREWGDCGAAAAARMDQCQRRGLLGGFVGR